MPVRCLLSIQQYVETCSNRTKIFPSVRMLEWWPRLTPSLFLITCCTMVFTAQRCCGQRNCCPPPPHPSRFSSYCCLFFSFIPHTVLCTGGHTCWSRYCCGLHRAIRLSDPLISKDIHLASSRLSMHLFVHEHCEFLFS